MRVFANFTPIIRILLWIMFAVSLAATILCVLIVSGVTIPLEISHAQAILLLFSSSIVVVVSILLNTVHYRITSTHLRLNVAFFDILGGRIRIENILNIVYKTEEGEKTVKKMYISYIWKGGDPVIAQIVTKPKNFDKIKQALMAKNTNIVFWDDAQQSE